ncbi:MAG: hypothetical protein ABIK21_08605 [bacterium]
MRVIVEKRIMPACRQAGFYMGRIDLTRLRAKLFLGRVFCAVVDLMPRPPEEFH